MGKVGNDKIRIFRLSILNQKAMKLLLDRKWKKDTYTIGRLYINGMFFCNTIEDKDRGLLQSMPLEEIKAKKVYSKTAIPRGVYTIKLTYSQKFSNRKWGKKYKGFVPLIDNVKAWSGVRIHPANTADELLGCIAPGENKVKGKVINSTQIYYKLMDNYIIPSINKNEEIILTII